ncbi:hypothetical protein C0992_007354 [Termitomyces sp. T32_za158]|nr:hypothetical protein C0992_007354 [Termitomyces sp. T32_za158]
MDIATNDDLHQPPQSPYMNHARNDPPAPPVPPPRPRRPTRQIPPLPPPATVNNESPVAIRNDSPPDDGEQAFESQLEQSPIPTILQSTDLTPVRAHYLKKSLVQLQFRREIDAITTHTPNNTSTLSFLGPPFSPPPKDAPFVDLPFLRYIFRQFVLTFPFMVAAPKDFYSEKLQPFVASALSRNLSPTSVLEDENADENADQTSRKKLIARVERNLAMFVGSAIKLVEQEQVVRLNQSDLDRLEMLARRRVAKVSKTRVVFEVNVIGVKTVVDKGRMRSRAHEAPRRYGDFRTLAAELQKAHPNEQIRPPPPKDRTAVMSTPISTMPLNTYDSAPYSSMNIPQSPSQTGLSTSRLAREKNRLTLRSYLHTLLAASKIASSPVIMSFLLSGPVNLTQAELEDAQRREEADKTREEGRKRFAKEIASRVDGLREAIKSVKGDVMGKDGLTHIFATVKVTPDVRSLPANYQAVLEWARISMASTVFHQFVASDNSSETFSRVLKISNPIAMIRGVLDLFLAQPFGGRSLLQRMFTSSLTEEVKALEGDIDAVKDKIDDPIMCTKIRQFVYAPREVQDLYKADAAAEGINLLTFVLRAGDEPVMSRAQMHRLAKAHRAHELYLKYRATLADSDDDDGPQNEDAWLMEDLKVLTHLYSRLRDREQLIALIFEGFTAELLKDIITIFYTPLAQVYRAASIADSLSDLQSFINDLIKTVEQVELVQEDPSRTVQAFINLIQRHEQSFYNFVHKVHSKGENLFGGLMHWVELFLTVVREGLGSPLSLEFLLPHTGKDREDILNEVDEVARYHYKLKVAYEGKLRRRFGRIQERDGDADIEDEVTQNLVNGVIGEIDFGELIHGDADDLAAEETDEESSDEYDDGSSEFESTDDSTSGESDLDDSSNEERSLPLPSRPSLNEAAIPPIRSQTLVATPAQSASIPVFRDDSPRKRSISLNSKSLPRRSQDLPPIPDLSLLPKSTALDRVSKPSSDSSVRSHEYSQIPITPARSQMNLRQQSTFHSDQSSKQRSDSSKRAQKSASQGSKKRKGMPALKPPELQHIPNLLPVFVEMVTFSFTLTFRYISPSCA